MEVEKVAEKSNLFITTLHFNYLRIYTRGVLEPIKRLRGSSFMSIVDGLKPSTVFTKAIRLGYIYIYIYIYIYMYLYKDIYMYI